MSAFHPFLFSVAAVARTDAPPPPPTAPLPSYFSWHFSPLAFLGGPVLSQWFITVSPPAALMPHGLYRAVGSAHSVPSLAFIGVLLLLMLVALSTTDKEDNTKK